MMQTNSQIAQTYVLNTYPCLSSWLLFVATMSKKSMLYDSTSCAQLALISKAAMKTIDYILINEANAIVVRVSRMLNDMHEYAWTAWTAFTALSNSTDGVMSITLSSTTLQAIITFNNWDIALNMNPSSFNPPILFNSILSGVTL